MPAKATPPPAQPFVTAAVKVLYIANAGPFDGPGKETLDLRKGLFLALVLAIIATLAGSALLVHWTAGGKAGTDDRLSFKKFTVGELLHFELKLDPKSCGKPLRSTELENIEKRVTALRGLPLIKPVVFTSLSEACLKARLTESLSEEAPSSEADADQKLLVALGLFPDGGDLEETLTNVFTEQIAGSYDTEEEEITVIEGKGMGGVMGELTMAHEITHALQDQNFDLDAPPLDDEAYNGDIDIAVESLVEGDAMSSMIDYAKEHVDVSTLLSSELSGSEVSSEELDRAPLYLRRSLLFPYEAGLTFVEALKKNGGWAAVDAAFGSPPLSSEQIMHPEKYAGRRDDPRPVPLADLSADLGKGWKLINSDTMGEFDVAVWFEQYGGLLASREAAGGWGGNTIQYYQGPGDRYVLVNLFAWDTPRDALEFFDGYRALLEKRFDGGARTVEDGAGWYLLKAEGQYFYCGISGDGTLCLQATDRAHLEKAVSRFPQYPQPGSTGVR